MKHIINIFEVDVPRCSKDYGVTCSAAIGVTDNGAGKCYKFSGTCQVPLEFEPSDTTVLRWCNNSEIFDAQKINAVPGLAQAEVSPQAIKPGESLGKRERCNIYLIDHADNDFTLDPYPESRGFNAYTQGTYLGRLVARLPNMVGYSCRRYVGEYDPLATDILSGLTPSHYVIDKVDLGVNGMQISVMDSLTFTDDKKALLPVPKNGILENDVPDSGPFSVNLLPVGIGATYPSSGFGSIDKEYVEYTITGDLLIVTARGVRESEEKSHKAGATFQDSVVLSGNVADILEQILSYTKTPLEYYDTTAWQDEATAHASEILEAHIATPTGAESLINRLMTEMALNIYSDVTNKKIKMRVLRPLPPTKSYSEDNLTNLQPAYDNVSRVDTVFFRFGRINPVEKIDEPKNYYGNLLKLDDNPKAVIQGNTAAIREINSVFIPETLRQTASDTAGLIIARYNRLSRSLTAITTPELSAELGDVVGVTCRFFQDFDGRPVQNIPMQVVRVKKGSAQHELTFQEYDFGGFNFNTDFVVSLPTDVLNINLRALYNATYGTGPIPDGAIIRFEGDPGVRVGSTSTGSFSLVDGDWPEIALTGVTVTVKNLRILGKGGNGGTRGGSGRHGGGAVYVRHTITFDTCEIGGGGGAGGDAYYGPMFGDYWADGAGGAGYQAGYGDTHGGSPADDLNGGTTFAGGGNGGDIGQGGSSGGFGPVSSTTPPGVAGVAIDGVSYITKVACTIYGSEIN